MIRGRTGYGEAERDTPAGRLRLEVKTVNHRFRNASIKTPSGFDPYEKAISDALKGQLGRGHISATLSIDRASAEVDSLPQIDLERARGYHAALVELRDALDLPGAPDLAMLTRFGDIFRAPEIDRTAGVEPDEIVDMADHAATACRRLRAAEAGRTQGRQRR